VLGRALLWLQRNLLAKGPEQERMLVFAWETALAICLVCELMQLPELVMECAQPQLAQETALEICLVLELAQMLAQMLVLEMQRAELPLAQICVALDLML